MNDQEKLQLASEFLITTDTDGSWDLQVRYRGSNKKGKKMWSLFQGERVVYSKATKEFTYDMSNSSRTEAHMKDTMWEGFEEPLRLAKALAEQLRVKWAEAKAKYDIRFPKLEHPLGSI